MKKYIALLLASVLVMTLLAGCGSKDDNQENKNNSEDSKTKVSIQTADDLEGKVIGVQTGTTGDLFITEDLEDEGLATVERYNKGFEAVQALLQGKVDAVVIDDQPAQVFVSENTGLKILATEYAIEDYAMAVAQDNEELLNNINEALKELKSNGVFDDIIDYYINDNEEIGRYESPADTDRSNGTLVMATNAEFPPYEYHEGDEIVGIDADLAQAIADILGMELLIEDMNFDSIIMAVKSGKADFGAAGLTITEEREREVNFTDTYYTGRQVIIVKE